MREEMAHGRAAAPILASGKHFLFTNFLFFLHSFENMCCGVEPS
jgi:hypothetical protein